MALAMRSAFNQVHLLAVKSYVEVYLHPWSPVYLSISLPEIPFCAAASPDGRSPFPLTEEQICLERRSQCLCIAVRKYWTIKTKANISNGTLMPSLALNWNTQRPYGVMMILWFGSVSYSSPRHVPKWVNLCTAKLFWIWGLTGEVSPRTQNTAACCQNHQRDWVVKFCKDCNEETDDVVMEVDFYIHSGCPERFTVQLWVSFQTKGFCLAKFVVEAKASKQQTNILLY